MKTMTYEIGELAFALPIQASTSGAIQGSGVPTGGGLLGLRPIGDDPRNRGGFTGALAPGSVVPGPVI